MLKAKLISICMLVFFIGCCSDCKETVNGVSLTTDRDLYHSGENMHISASIDANTAIDNVSLRFYGIFSKIYRLERSEIADLSKGSNEIRIQYEAPSCYGCAGIRPGTYNINLDIAYMGKSIGNATRSIEIRQ